MTTPNRPPLSPAAQAVMDAAYNAVWPWEISKAQQADAREIAAAALRAAADQVEQKLRGFSHEACQEIRSIATELEGHHG